MSGGIRAVGSKKRPVENESRKKLHEQSAGVEPFHDIIFRENAARSDERKRSVQMFGGRSERRKCPFFEGGARETGAGG